MTIGNPLNETAGRPTMAAQVFVIPFNEVQSLHNDRPPRPGKRNHHV